MRWVVLFALTLAACAFSRPHAASPAPFTYTPAPGETTAPLPLVQAVPLPLATPTFGPATVTPTALRPGAKLVTAAAGAAYYAFADQLVAVDLAQGRERWTVGGVLPGEASAGSSRVFVPSAAPEALELLAFDARTGSRVMTLPHVRSGHVLHDVLYAQHVEPLSQSFTAYDAVSGRALWSVRGLAGGPDPPHQLGGTLLQSFWQSGAILHNSMYAIDVRTGRVRWMTAKGPAPLGTSGGTVYLDSSWEPGQFDRYEPLVVATVDLARGKALHEITYRPDPQRNWPPTGDRPHSASARYVAGGFVYLEVGAHWYRYDADRDPAEAHAALLERTDIRAVLSGTRLIVTHGDRVAVADSLPDRLELRALGTGPLRSNVVVRDDGTHYAVVGDDVVAIDADGERARKLGGALCSSVQDVIPWDGGVTLRCIAADLNDAASFVVFRDSAWNEHAPSLPRPQPAPTPAFVANVKLFPIPRPQQSPLFEKQWWLGSIAATSSGVAFTMNRGAMNLNSAVGRMTYAGNFTIAPLEAGEAPIFPTEIVTDAHGVTWFNDGRHATVTAWSPSGAFHPVLIGAPATPLPSVPDDTGPIWARVRRPEIGIRIATGPDGEVWFARSHPTRMIGRVQGTARYDIPEEFGDVLSLRGGNDGALWFVASKGLGRMTTDGAFTRIALPERQTPSRVMLTSGAGATMWVLDPDGHLMQVDVHRVVRALTLPNATDRVVAMTTGCDGALYVAEEAPQIVRFAPDGSAEEYPINVFSVNGITRAPDCSIWFTAGSNAPDQQIGRFTLERRR